jgi:hypothetical protein
MLLLEIYNAFQFVQFRTLLCKSRGKSIYFSLFISHIAAESSEDTLTSPNILQTGQVKFLYTVPQVFTTAG